MKTQTNRMVAGSLLGLLMLTGSVLAAPAGETKTVVKNVSGVLVGSATFEFDPNAPPGSFGVRALLDAAGDVKHLGAAVIHAEHTPWPGPEGRVTDGEFTITAANGDQISGIYEGTSEPPDPETDIAIGHANFVVTGGTGRFKDVSGIIQAAVFIVVGPSEIGAVWPITYVLEGTVDLPSPRRPHGE